MEPQAPLSTSKQEVGTSEYISFFKPATEGMRAETRLISIIVIIWAVMVYLMPFLLVVFQETPDGASFLTRAKFLGFPFHYWYSTQFTTVGFVLLCAIFSFFIEKIYDKYRR